MQQHEFDSKYCAKLNTQQLEAVHCVDGPVLLLAVPGSGKTTVLVTRLGYMVCCRGIDPRRILTMTYTVAATLEMKQRFARSFGENYAREMEFCTINSLASQIIGFYSRRHGRAQAFELVENEAAVAVVGRLYQEINNDYANDSVIKDIRSGITYIKNMMLSAGEIESLDLGIDNMAKLYQGYCKALRNQGLMDFDDQLAYALTILKKFPDVLEHFQDRFPYICVDESQDTSKIQHEIIKILAAKHGNLFMVGDEDQSIYGFRAAWPEALLNFEQDHPGARVLLMEHNYRSTEEIVALADAFIARNKNRHPKTLRAARGCGEQPQLIEAVSRKAQFDFLFELGRQCNEETAILYRNNDSALPLVDMFQRRGVSYNCRRFEDGFFTHRVVADIRDIICLAHEPKNAEIFMRVYYKLGSPISRRAAELACDDASRGGTSIMEALAHSPELGFHLREAMTEAGDLLSALPGCSAETAIMQIWKGLKYSSYVAMNGLDAGKYDILCLLAGREKSPLDFLRRLDELHRLVLEHKNSPENKLMLSTIHSSKGLEYERVYLLDMFDGILPSKKKTEIKTDEEQRQYEEDRRVFYVGMTRAKNELYLFKCQDREAEFVSELAARIPEELVDEEDIFAPMKQPLCGRSYSHREKGRGRITAQCGDRLLLEWKEHEPELMTLSELMTQRDMSRKYSESRKKAAVKPEAPMPDIKVQIGTRLRHTVFGPGTVLFVKDDIAAIAFSREIGTKRIMLGSSLKNGILMPE